MKIHLVCFNTKYAYGIENYYEESYERLSKSFLENGGDEIHHYTEENIPTNDYEKQFYEKYKTDYFGFYSFKPLIILDVFEKISFGDVVLYHDVGRPEYNFEFRKNIRNTAILVDKEYLGIGVGRGMFSHNEYTRDECFKLMNCDDVNLRNSFQLAANWGFYQKNHMVIEFINLWKHWCFAYDVVRTEDDGEKNHIDFKSHRWDQSILTNLHFIYNLQTLPNLNEFSWEKDINNFLIE